MRHCTAIFFVILALACSACTKKEVAKSTIGAAIGTAIDVSTGTDIASGSLKDINNSSLNNDVGYFFSDGLVDWVDENLKSSNGEPDEFETETYDESIDVSDVKVKTYKTGR